MFVPDRTYSQNYGEHAITNKISGSHKQINRMVVKITIYETVRTVSRAVKGTCHPS